MNVTIDRKDDLNATIEVNIAANDYAVEVDKKLKVYRQKANIPGFRPGMAPKSMIEKMYGTSLLLESVNELASKGLFNYIDEHKLNILGQPVLTDDTKIDGIAKDKDYTFRFDVGLTPQFQLNVSKADAFTRYIVKVEEKEVDEELARFKKRYGTLSTVDEAGDNDMVYCRFEELDDEGNPLEGGAHADNSPVLTSGIKNEEVKRQFIGARKDDVIDVNIFALFDNDETEISHVLGVQKVGVSDLSPKFRLHVQEIKRNVEAELTQEVFDRAYGEGNIKSEEELRAKIREELEGFFKAQAEHLLEHGLIDSLVERQNIPLPDAFLKRWMIDHNPGRYNAENIEHSYHHEAEYLRNHLFEEKILDENNVKVEEEDIRNAALDYTRQMFGQYGTANLPDNLLLSIVEPELKKEEYRSRMINIAVSRKVRELAKSLITIEEKEIGSAEFLQLVEEHNKAHHSHKH
jgi:trigger factor